MSTTTLNYGAGAQPRSNLLGTDGWFGTEIGGAFVNITPPNVAFVSFDPSAIAAIRVFSFVGAGTMNIRAEAQYAGTATITDDNTDTHTIVEPLHGISVQPVEPPATVLAWTMFSALTGGGVYGLMRGTSTTNGLAVAGRAMNITVTDHGYVDAMAAVVPAIIIPIGNVSGGGSDGPLFRSSISATRCLIPEVDYTTAIRAAGNTFTDAGATVWEVAGLYETVGV